MHHSLLNAHRVLSATVPGLQSSSSIICARASGVMSDVKPYGAATSGFYTLLGVKPILPLTYLVSYQIIRNLLSIAAEQHSHHETPALPKVSC